MPFAYPATEVFDPQGARRVVWSQEEYELAIAEGFCDTAPLEPAAAMIQDEEPVKRGPGRPRKEVIFEG